MFEALVTRNPPHFQQRPQAGIHPACARLPGEFMDQAHQILGTSSHESIS